MSYKSDLEMIRRNPATRYALLGMLEQFERMDPVDALHDAQCLLGFQQKRCEELLERKLP
jgi:hypothetical protein